MWSSGNDRLWYVGMKASKMSKVAAVSIMCEFFLRDATVQKVCLKEVRSTRGRGIMGRRTTEKIKKDRLMFSHQKMSVVYSTVLWVFII